MNLHEVFGNANYDGDLGGMSTTCKTEKYADAIYSECTYADGVLREVNKGEGGLKQVESELLPKYRRDAVMAGQTVIVEAYARRHLGWVVMVYAPYTVTLILVHSVVDYFGLLSMLSPIVSANSCE